MSPSKVEFTEPDLQKIKTRGLAKRSIENQIKRFEAGFTALKLNRVCTINDGILQIENTRFDHLCYLHVQAAANGRLMKFVPSSGAASRMFKPLEEFCNREDHSLDLDTEEDPNDPVANYARRFLKNLHEFAFFPELRAILDPLEIDLDSRVSSEQFQIIINKILSSDGLNYSAKPKGIIPFHKYEDNARTAFQEQLAEGIETCSGANNEVKFHFTVSDGDQTLVSEHIEDSLHLFDENVRFEIDYSVQNPATDTIALDEDMQPFRDNNGVIVLRPGGHGSLLMNLSALDADIVFIKNIDNVTPEYYPSQTTLYKKLLCGVLIEMQDQIFSYLRDLENPDVTEETLDTIYKFAFTNLWRIAPDIWGNYTSEEKRVFLIDTLDRPIRVCGMVKNTGEPGGGPFWVEDEDRNLSLQIVEKAQINLDDPEQVAILRDSTHFNPVDLVCGLKNYRGQAFDLHKFTDPDSGIISRKSYQGRTLLALEHPGLWNGAMARWNTIFVETPLSTFNPVKTVNDLLRDEHLPTIKALKD